MKVDSLAILLHSVGRLGGRRFLEWRLRMKKKLHLTVELIPTKSFRRFRTNDYSQITVALLTAFCLNLAVVAKFFETRKTVTD